jgi:hypothetical protein
MFDVFCCKLTCGGGGDNKDGRRCQQPPPLGYSWRGTQAHLRCVKTNKGHGLIDRGCCRVQSHQNMLKGQNKKKHRCLVNYLSSWFEMYPWVFYLLAWVAWVTSLMYYTAGLLFVEVHMSAYIF